jgi:hypothetical protein
MSGELAEMVKRLVDQQAAGREQQATELRKVLAEFEGESKTVSEPDVAVRGSQNEVSDVYENNCTHLLVKAIYNEGDGLQISSSWRDRANSKFVLPNSKLTPDFAARVSATRNGQPQFPACLVSTRSCEPPRVFKNELVSPPSSTSTTPTKESKSKT